MHVIITTHGPRTIEVIELESYFLTLLMVFVPKGLNSRSPSIAKSSVMFAQH